MSLAVMNVVENLRREIRGAAGDQVLYQTNTMEQLASSSLDQQHVLLLLFGIFAGMALLLACIDIYGVLSYVTNQRVPEIGVRIALGATSHDVIRLVLRQSLATIVFGVGGGATGAIAAAETLKREVPGV